MNRLYSLTLGALATLGGFTLQATELSAQGKAAVYCPEATGCNNVVNALSGSFPAGVDRVFNGTSGTVNIQTADMSQYGVLVIPSLSDNGSRQPYSLLRNAEVASKLSAVLTGRVAVWSGTPDQGKASRDSKDALIRNQAQYAAAEYATTNAPGLVVLQDASATMSARYNWLAGISGRSISADPSAKVFGRASALTEIGTKVIGGLAYGNMASFGLTLPGDGNWEAGAAGKELTTAFNGLTSTGALGMSGAGLVNTVKAFWASMFAPDGHTVFASSPVANGQPHIQLSSNLISPSTAGQALEFGATVTLGSPTGTAITCGTVTITATRQGSTASSGALPLTTSNRGVVTWQPTLAAGTWSVKADYPKVTGSACSNNAASATGTHMVNAAVLATNVRDITASPSVVGGTTELRAQVSPTNVSGSVTFHVNGSTTAAVGTVSYNSETGVATLSNYTHGLDARTTAYSVRAVFSSTSSSYTGNEETNSSALTVGKAGQATLTYDGPTSGAFGAKLTPSASGGSGTGAVSFGAIGTACQMGTGEDAGKVVITAGTGTCAVTATKAADSNYDVVSSSPASITVSKIAQSISFTAPAPTAAFNSTFAVAPTASSNLAVNVVASGVCSLASGTVTMTSGTGDCTITATQAGNDNYGAATQVQHVVAASKASATINLSGLTGQTYNGSVKSATATTDPAGLGGVSITYDGSTTAPTAAGSYVVVASLTNDNYSATNVTGTLTIGKADQSAVTVTAPASMTYGQAAVALTATGGNGTGVYSFSVGSSTGCSIASGNQLSVSNAAGMCAVTASRAGDGNYNASAASASATVTLNKADQTINWDAPAAITYGTALSATQLNASASGTLTYNPAAGTMLNVGTHELKVTAAATDNYSAADKTVSLTVNKADQVILSVTGVPGTDQAFGTTFTVGSSGGSGTGSVTFSASGACSNTAGGALITVSSGSGTCSVTATKAADNNFNSATSGAATVGATRANQIISWSNPVGIAYGTALSGTQLNATLTTGDGALSYSPASGTMLGAGSGQTLRVDAAETANYNAAFATVTIDVAKAAGSVSINNLPTTATFGGSFTPAYTTAGDGAGSTSSLSTSVCTVSAGVVNYVGTGSCQLQASVAEGTNHLAASGSTQSFTVGAAATATTVTVTPSTQQYSDLVTLNATVRSDAAGTQGGTVQFKIDGVNVGPAQTLSGGSANLTDYPLTQAPGGRSVTAVFTSTNSNFAGSTSGAETLTVTKEDARVDYTGLEFVNTPSATSSTASVTLSATIRDITAVMGDANAGDIRKARVKFMADGTEVCPNLTPQLVNSTDSKTGTVSCTWTPNIGNADSQPFTIRVVVDDHYTGEGQGVVTVSKPISSMITGGGHLINEFSTGQYAGGAGLKTNFGFNVKYNRQMTNLQGNVNIIIRAADGKMYQIKANSMTSLQTTPTGSTGGGPATFESKANVTDITDPNNPISLGGNRNLLMTMRDNGEPGTGDVIGITLRDTNGALLFSSRWDGVKTVEQNLRGGNVVVR